MLGSSLLSPPVLRSLKSEGGSSTPPSSYAPCSTVRHFAFYNPPSEFPVQHLPFLPSFFLAIQDPKSKGPQSPPIRCLFIFHIRRSIRPKADKCLLAYTASSTNYFLVSAAAATFMTSLLFIASSFFLTFLEKYSCSVLFKGSPWYFFKTSSFCFGANRVLR